MCSLVPFVLKDNTVGGRAWEEDVTEEVLGVKREKDMVVTDSWRDKTKDFREESSKSTFSRGSQCCAAGGGTWCVPVWLGPRY